MQSKKSLIIEFSIAGLILIILCGVMLPKFLQSQRSGAPYRLIKNLQVLVDAIEAYQAGHGGVPDHVFDIDPGRIKIHQSRFDVLRNRYPMENIREPYQFFYESGYLDQIPDFNEFDDFLITKRHPSSKYEFSINQEIHISGYSRKTQNGLNDIINICIHFYYPLSDTDDLFQFIDMTIREEKMITSTKYFNDNEMWMNPEIFYSPTNGLSSAGFIYVDSAGNHSPW